MEYRSDPNIFPKVLGLAPLKAMLKSAGGWPLLEGQAWREEEFTWSELSLQNNGIVHKTDKTKEILAGMG